jgi:hypothetical protein
MSQLHGKQLRNSSTSLNKLTGTGIVEFGAATMSFTADAVLTRLAPLEWENNDLVNKFYVDSVAQGLDVKLSVKAKFNTNQTLSGLPTQTGVDFADGDRVLLTGQTSGPDNGIWLISENAWTRPLDFDTDEKVTAGSFTFVEEGEFENSGFVLTTNDEIILGTTTQSWSQFSGAGQITAGDGLTKTGNTLDVDLGTGLTFSGNKVIINTTGVTPDSYGSAGSVSTFTVNSEGQLTVAGETTIDITASQVSDFATASETAIFTDANFVDSNSIEFTVTSGESVTADIILDGGTASGLTVSNDGVSVMIDNNTIVQDSNGVLQVNSSAVVPEVSNGLSINGGDIVLGGTLSMTTEIDANGNDLVITGADNLLFESEVFDVSATSLIILDAGATGSVDIYGGDVTIFATGSVDIASTETFGLQTVTASITTSSLEGLVYTNDYSATFVDNSLITKLYVDNSVANSTYFAGDGLLLTGLTFSIASSAAGSGLTYSAGVFNVDLATNSGLTLTGDKLAVDSNIAGNGLDYSAGVLSVNTTDITTALAGNGLTANGPELDVNVNADSLEIVGDVIRLKDTVTGGRTFSNTVNFGENVVVADGLTVTTGGANITGDTYVQGNFTVSGTVSYINTEELVVKDNIITLASGQTGSPTVDSGIKVERGDEDQARLIWKENIDLWTAGLTGSEHAIALYAGDGLLKDQNSATFSLDYTIFGNGFTVSGTTVSVDTSEITAALAGAGLTSNGGELDVNVDESSIVINSNNDLSLAPTVTNGVTFSAEVNFTDNVDIIGEFTVTGTSSITGDFDVIGDTTLTGELTVTGTASFTSLIEANGGLTATDGYFSDSLQTPNAPTVGDDVINLTYFGASYSQLQDQIDDISGDFITAIEVGPGLTVSSGTEGTASISILDSTAGNGLTFSSGVYDVKTGLGLEIAGDDVAMIWGGTQTGLTFSSNAISANVDGTTIVINNDGKLAVSIDGFKSEPVYQLSTGVTSSGATYATGLLLSATPSQYSRVQVFVNGLNVRVGSGTSSAGTSPAYFQNGSIRDINDLDITCQLIWNSGVAGYQLEGSDEIEFVYEA